MEKTSKRKGPWGHRVLVVVLSVVLAFLVYWLLGFILADIGNLPGPSYSETEKEFLDAQVLRQESELRARIEQLRQAIDDNRQRQAVLRESTRSSQQTMNQLLEFQRLSLQKGVKPSAQEQQALAESQKVFLSNQKRYQALNEQIAQQSEQLMSLQRQLRDVQKDLGKQRKVARHHYNELRARHNLKIAAVKLTFLVPLLIVAAFLSVKKRESVYAPIYVAAGFAVAVKVGFVMHEYFPARIFKYILVLVALAIVLRLLILLLRMVAFPRKQWLLKQYREAYERFLCPVCSYPMRRGPLKYAFWTRRTIKKMTAAEATPPVGADEPYTCPACGTRVYEECDSCHSIRPSLLPFCEKCGAEKEIA